MPNTQFIQKLTIALFVFLPIIFNLFGFDIFALPRVFFLYIISFILLTLILFQFVKNKKIEIKYTKFHILLALFLFFIILSTIFSQDKYTAIWGYVWDYEGLFSWICYFLLFYIGYIYFRQKKDIEKFILALSLPIFLVGLYAIIQYFFDFNLMEWQQKTEIKRSL